MQLICVLVISNTMVANHTPTFGKCVQQVAQHGHTTRRYDLLLKRADTSKTIGVHIHSALSMQQTSMDRWCFTKAYIYIHMIWHVRWVCLKNMDILKLHKHAISMATRWWTLFFFGAGLGVTKNLDAVWHNLFLWELSWAMEWFGMGRFPLLYSNMVTWMGHDGTFPTKWVFRCIQIMLNICLGLAIHPILPDKWLFWSISMG